MQTAVLVSIAIVVVLVVLFGLFIWASYHSLIALRTRVDEAWRDIEDQMQRRAELVPVVVNAVGGYASHEKAVLRSVSGAREEVLAASGPGDASTAETHLQQALRQAIAVADGYPGLSSSPSFLQLQSDLGESEERVQASRRFYNGGVREFNTKIQVFPNNMLARRMNLKPREFFEAAEGTAVAGPPRIQF